MEYKFRGKLNDANTWVVGYYVKAAGDRHYILTGQDWGVHSCADALSGKLFSTEYFYEVDPATVGQFTTHELGLYVGDIVNYITGNPSRQVNAVVEFGEYETYTHFNKEEGDVEKHIGFYINDGKCKMPLQSLWLAKIGNIHDHPHLLNPASGQAGVNNMIDPNVKAEQATEQESAAAESAAQDTAMEVTDSEEGTTEG